MVMSLRFFSLRSLSPLFCFADALMKSDVANVYHLNHISFFSFIIVFIFLIPTLSVLLYIPNPLS